jgi:hypothetical protein
MLLGGLARFGECRATAYFVESEHLSRHLSSILEGNFHAVVNLQLVSMEHMCMQSRGTYQILLHANVSQSVLCAILFSGQGHGLRSSGTYHFALSICCRHAEGGASEDDFELWENRVQSTCSNSPSDWCSGVASGSNRRGR